MHKMTRDEVLSLAAENHLGFVAVAFGHIRDWQAAEDIVQESYLTMSKRWEDYREGSSIFQWGRTIIRYKCMDFGKTKWRTSSFSNEYIEKNMHLELENFFDQSTSLEMESQIRTLSYCMNTLNERSKKLLYEFYVQGQMCKDIAKKDGKKEKTYSMHLWRLRSRLRNCMKKNAVKEEEPTLEEEIVDDYFISSDTDCERICNLLKSEKEAGRPVFANYVQEWSVFATALKRIFEKQENADGDGSKLNEVMLDSEEINMSTASVIPELSNQSTDSSVFSRLQNKTSVFSGIAACLIITFVIWNGIARPNQEKQLAFIESGAATIANEASRSEISAKSGYAILPGDIITVTDGQTCRIRYIKEESMLNITGPSSLTFSLSDNGARKTIKVTEGTLWANIAKQASGKALEMETNSAYITVIGTRFRLAVSKMETDLFLESGRLLIKKKDSNEEKLMTPGQHAIVNAKGINIQFKDQNQPANFADEENLIARYRFDEGEGNVILDSSTHGNNLKLSNSLNAKDAWIDGPLGKAIYFGSVNEPEKTPRFMVNNFSNHNIAQQLSILFWINCGTSSIDQLQSIMSCQARNKSGFSITTGKRKGSYDIRFSTFNETSRNTLGSNTRLRLNQWYHVAFTFEDGTVRCYIDGEFDSSKQFIGNKIEIDPGKPLGIGPRLPPFEMAFDNLSIYSQALSSSAIQTERSIR